jgi:hypothetical protein
MELGEEPWNELLWNPVSHRMITAGENRNVAFSVLYYGIGGDLRQIRKSATDVRTEWAGILNRQPSAVRLRRWV